MLVDEKNDAGSLILGDASTVLEKRDWLTKVCECNMLII